MAVKTADAGSGGSGTYSREGGDRDHIGEQRKIRRIIRLLQRVRTQGGLLVVYEL